MSFAFVFRRVLLRVRRVSFLSAFKNVLEELTIKYFLNGFCVPNLKSILYSNVGQRD